MLSTMQTDAGVSLPQLLRRDCTIAATRAGELSSERLDAALGRVVLATCMEVLLRVLAM